MNHLRMLINLNCSSNFPLFIYNKAHINCHRFFAMYFENLWCKFLRRWIVLALWNKHISWQLNLLRFNLDEEFLEVRIVIQHYFLYLFSIIIFSFLNFYICDFAPLIFEFIFEKFTRLHIKHYDFFWCKWKFRILFLKFLHIDFEFLIFFLLLIFY